MSATYYEEDFVDDYIDLSPLIEDNAIEDSYTHISILIENNCIYIDTNSLPCKFDILTRDGKTTYINKKTIIKLLFKGNKLGKLSW